MSTTHSYNGIKIIVEQDYEDYFLNIIRNAIDSCITQGKTIFQTIKLYAGPYMAADMWFGQYTDYTYLKFYSACRIWGGEYTSEDIEYAITRTAPPGAVETPVEAVDTNLDELGNIVNTAALSTAASMVYNTLAKEQDN